MRTLLFLFSDGEFIYFTVLFISSKRICKFSLMSVIVIAVASESGVPIFSRKRGNNENVSYQSLT